MRDGFIFSLSSWWVNGTRFHFHWDRIFFSYIFFFLLVLLSIFLERLSFFFPRTWSSSDLESLPQQNWGID